MNYYKVSNSKLARDGVDTFAHLTNGKQTVVSDMDVRRVLGYGLSPADIQSRYGVAPLTPREKSALRNSKTWTMNRKKGGEA